MAISEPRNDDIHDYLNIEPGKVLFSVLNLKLSIIEYSPPQIWSSWGGD